MSAEQTCEATATHPTLDVIGCELPAGHPGPHVFDPQDGEGKIEWDDEQPARADFDVEAFVKALPEGVVLCPMCLGIGGVVDEPPFDPHTYRCPTCDGHGQTRTGSRQTGKEAVRECVDCNGSGYRHRGTDEPPARPARAADFEPELQPVDVHGRTPDDPDFDWTRVVERAPPAAAEPEPAPA